MAAAMQAHNTEQKTDLRCRLHHERRSASTHREWLAREWHGLIYYKWHGKGVARTMRVKDLVDDLQVLPCLVREGGLRAAEAGAGAGERGMLAQRCR